MKLPPPQSRAHVQTRKKSLSRATLSASDHHSALRLSYHNGFRGTQTISSSAPFLYHCRSCAIAGGDVLGKIEYFDFKLPDRLQS